MSFSVKHYFCSPHIRHPCGMFSNYLNSTCYVEFICRRRVWKNHLFTICSAALTSETALLACSSRWQGWRAFNILLSSVFSIASFFSLCLPFHFLSTLYCFCYSLHLHHYFSSYVMFCFLSYQQICSPHVHQPSNFLWSSLSHLPLLLVGLSLAVNMPLLLQLFSPHLISTLGMHPQILELQHMALLSLIYSLSLPLSSPLPLSVFVSSAALSHLHFPSPFHFLSLSLTFS